MGATGWKYFVPYKADVSSALQRLRDRIFASGDYSGDMIVTKSDYERALKTVGSDAQSDLDFFAAQAADPRLPRHARNKFAALVRQLQQLNDSSASEPKPSTIEELLKKVGESGTHSILDIIRISNTPEFGAIHPLPDSGLALIFGTVEPSATQIKTKYKEGLLEEYVTEPWQGIYIVAYKGGEPSEVFFAGCSGD